MGCEERPGVRSDQPPSLSPAVELVFTCTSVMVMYTCANGPVGPAHVAGSLSITFAEPVADEEGAAVVEFPPHAAATMPASSKVETKNRDQ